MNFIRVEKTSVTLFEAPILNGKAQDQAIQRKIEDLNRIVGRLSGMHSHDELVLLENSWRILKSLHLLSITDCSSLEFVSIWRCSQIRRLRAIYNRPIEYQPKCRQMTSNVSSSQYYKPGIWNLRHWHHSSFNFGICFNSNNPYCYHRLIT